MSLKKEKIIMHLYRTQELKMIHTTSKYYKIVEKKLKSIWFKLITMSNIRWIYGKYKNIYMQNYEKIIENISKSIIVLTLFFILDICLLIQVYIL